MSKTMEQPDTDRLAAGLVDQTEAFATAVAGGDWDMRVPTCPDWKLRVLVAHIGQASRWAAGIVRTREAAPIPDPHDATPPGDWERWLRSGADDLIAAVRTTGANTPVWTFAGPRQAKFWLRRTTHDTTVHRVDAALHTQVSYELSPDLAADAITEALELLALPVAERLWPALTKLRGRGETMRIDTIDAGGQTWLVTRTPSGVRVHPDTGTADVVLTGTAQELLLVLTHRLPPARVAVQGETALLDHWLAHSSL